MAKVLGFNPQQNNDYLQLVQKVEMQEKLIEELVNLNQQYEVEVKRLVQEYDKLYKNCIGSSKADDFQFVSIDNTLPI